MLRAANCQLRQILFAKERFSHWAFLEMFFTAIKIMHVQNLHTAKIPACHRQPDNTLTSKEVFRLIVIHRKAIGPAILILLTVRHLLKHLSVSAAINSHHTVPPTELGAPTIAAEPARRHDTTSSGNATVRSPDSSSDRPVFLPTSCSSSVLRIASVNSFDHQTHRNHGHYSTRSVIIADHQKSLPG